MHQLWEVWWVENWWVEPWDKETALVHSWPRKGRNLQRSTLTQRSPVRFRGSLIFVRYIAKSLPRSAPKRVFAHKCSVLSINQLWTVSKLSQLVVNYHNQSTQRHPVRFRGILIFVWYIAKSLPRVRQRGSLLANALFFRSTSCKL